MQGPERVAVYRSEADRIAAMVPSLEAVEGFLEGGRYPGLAAVMEVADFFQNRAVAFHARRIARPPQVPVDPHDPGFRTWTSNWLRKEHRKAHDLACRVRDGLTAAKVESRDLARCLHRYLGRLAMLLPLEQVGLALPA